MPGNNIRKVIGKRFPNRHDLNSAHIFLSAGEEVPPVLAEAGISLKLQLEGFKEDKFTDLNHLHELMATIDLLLAFVQKAGNVF